ncbi:MAG: HAMP domain-containing histidine kinase [Elusimicrobia bacterium]|nr:HAMP domain-containing histidine kinase [Elusimicrobiota bacterium]
MTLRAKFTLGALLLTESVLICSIAAILILERRHLLARQRANQQAALERFAEVCRDSLIDKNDLLAVNYMKAIAFSSEVSYTLLADASGKVRVHSELLKGGRTAIGTWLDAALTEAARTAVMDREAGGARVREWAKPVLVDGKVAGWALMGYSIDALESDVRRALQETAMRLLAVALALSILGVLGASALARRLSRSLTDLSLAAERMGRGDMDAQVQIWTKDELGTLVSAFNRMASQLKRLEEIRVRMIAGISHDFKAPLSAISAYEQSLEELSGAPQEADRRSCLEGIAMNVKRLTLMAEDILGYARLQEGLGLSPSRSPVSLKDVSEEALRLLDSMVKESGVAVENRISDSFPPVSADPAMILRVLINLLSNSLKFTPRSGFIFLEARATTGFAEVTLKDTGVGISADRMGRLFTRFMEAGEGAGTGRAKGTGFGLSVCKEIVEAHGGAIRAESEVGKGTSMILTLPFAPEAAP